MADQSIFENLLVEALEPITQDLKLLAKASYMEERLKALEETIEKTSKRGSKSKTLGL